MTRLGSKHSVRLQAAVHADGELWAVRNNVQRMGKAGKWSGSILMPSWCVWEGTSTRVMFATVSTDDELGIAVYSSRPRPDNDSMRASAPFHLGKWTLKRETLCYDHTIPLEAGRLFGVGDFPEGERLRVTALDTGSTALITTVLTDLAPQTDITHHSRMLSQLEPLLALADA